MQRIQHHFAMQVVAHAHAQVTGRRAGPRSLITISKFTARWKVRVKLQSATGAANCLAAPQITHIIKCLQPCIRYCRSLPRNLLGRKDLFNFQFHSKVTE